MINSISTQVGEGRVAKVADFGLTRDVYIDEAYWKRSSGKCNYFQFVQSFDLVLHILFLCHVWSSYMAPNLGFYPQCQ